MASAAKSHLLSFMDELIPTIRTALSDRYWFSLFYFILNNCLELVPLVNLTSNIFIC